jgi:Putative auto-transporter adhesin, head GIN domain
MAMAVTSPPQRSDRPEQHVQPSLIVAVIAVLVLGAIGVALALRGGHSSSGSGIQGSGVAATQTRAVPTFTSLYLAGGNEVSVVVGAPRSVVVHADTNLISHVTTRVAAGTLIIGDTGSYTSHSPMYVEVSVPSLTALNLSGDGQLSVTGISAPQLTVTVSGSGLLSASGTVTRLDVTLRGDGMAELSQLSARDVHALLAGSGLIKVNATSSLNASVPGTGLIIYTGNPSHVVTSVPGSGRGSIVAG